MKRNENRMLRASDALLLSLTVAAVSPLTSWAQATPVSSVSRTEAAVVLTRWLECTECDGGELKAVMAYGEAIVPRLTAALNKKPTVKSCETLCETLQKRYDALKKQEKNKPEFEIRSTKDQFVTRYIEGWQDQHSIRAAQALGAIGGKNARTALENASRKTHRADAREAIQEALQQISAR